MNHHPFTHRPNYYPFGSSLNTRGFSAGTGFRFGFNGKEKQGALNDVDYDYGARIYDGSLGKFLSIDPHCFKYPEKQPYQFAGNYPLIASDFEGKDIIILIDKGAAGNLGHQAILIGDNVNGWTYVSKDGSPNGCTAAAGKPIFVVEEFTSVEEFRNSPHNFELIQNQHHSTSEGVSNSKISFKLDKNGNKIKRYDEAFYIGTTQINGLSTDKSSLKKAIHSASSLYCLTISDCSDVVSAALSVGKNSSGKELNTGETETGVLILEAPRIKQLLIELKNDGQDYDAAIKPDSLKLQTNEKGKKEKKSK